MTFQSRESDHEDSFQDHAKPKGQIKNHRNSWLLIGASLVALVLALTFPLWFPGIARRFVPDRYIVAYFPDPLREMVLNTDNLQVLPTAVPIDPGAVAELLATPTIVATLGDVSGGGGETATAEPTPISVGPTATLTPAFVSEATIDALPTAIPASALLTGFTFTPQGWNKCGPATLTTNLSFWGIEVTQNDVSNAIKPHPEDSNVSPDELAFYAETVGYGVIYRMNGDLEMLKEFVAAGYPVLVERGFDELPDLGWMGHYMLLIGFDDADQEFQMLDAYWGHNRVHEDQNFPVETWGYDNFDRVWRHFNRTYVVVYPPDDALIIAEIIGDDMDDSAMYISALQRTQDELRLNADDVFGWFNLGTILTELGDYEGAASAYDQARNIGLPFRMLWYQFGIYEAYYQTGRYEDVMTLANVLLAIDNYPESEESFYYRGLVYQARGQDRAARREFNQALKFNAGYVPAQLALETLTDE